MSDEQTYKFNVNMTCSGCSGAVTRALTKQQETLGISSFDVNLEKKEVIVKSTAPYEDVYSTLAKTGKQVISGEVVPPAPSI